MTVLNDFNTSVERALGEIDPKWRDYNGLVVCGTHTPRDIEYMIYKIQEAREKGIPFLGICFGYQLAAIEWARSMMGIKDATSEEFNEPGTKVVKKREEGLKVGLHDGESYWSNYDLAIQLPAYPKNYFVAPFHPEYQSMKGNPHPLLVSFLDYAKTH